MGHDIVDRQAQAHDTGVGLLFEDNGIVSMGATGATVFLGNGGGEDPHLSRLGPGFTVHPLLLLPAFLQAAQTHFRRTCGQHLGKSPAPRSSRGDRYVAIGVILAQKIQFVDCIILPTGR